MSEDNVKQIKNALAEAVKKAVDDVEKEKQQHILVHGIHHSHSSGDWDTKSYVDESEIPPLCLARIKRDLMSIYQEPPPGIIVIPEENDITLVHALITGCFDTPYEGGFFYFILRFPHEYPMIPMKVKLMTTGGNRVRFNPNLYKCGKVCMSLLGTWSGPAWSPAHTMSSILISIQSLLNEKPYFNEPGFEKERHPGDVEKYSAIVQHETLRVAVIGMLDNDYGVDIPKQFVNAMEKNFLQYYDFYELLATTNLPLDGKKMQDPFGDERGTFQYARLLQRLKTIKERLETACSNHSSSASSIESD